MRRALVAHLVTAANLCGSSDTMRRSMSSEGFSSMPINHHLSASVGVHSIISTACGRSFDPNIYNELIHACCDQKWLSAIQRSLRDDKEYTEMLTQEGGVAATLREMSDRIHHDDEFMEELKDKLRKERNISLTLCALQDAYLRIRQRRDKHESSVAAGDNDPYKALKQRKVSFGQQNPF